MYKTLYNSLQQWNKNNDERAKLQHGYVAFAIITIVAAGLVGLVDYGLGQSLTTVALLALGVFFVNLITWTLLNGIVLAYFDRRVTAPKPVQKKKTAKK